MSSLILIVTALGVIIYMAIKSSISKNNLQQKKEELHYITLPEVVVTAGYEWKDYNPLTKEEYKTAFTEEGLAHKWEYFEKHLKSEIRIKPKHVDENLINIGQSKLGGRPDLPSNIEWPKQKNGKHLVFLAQINFEELDQRELDLPDKGMLYFFCEEAQEFYGDSKDNQEDFRTIFIEEAADLERIETPNTFTILRNGRYKACALEFSNSYSLPNWEHSLVDEMITFQEHQAYVDISSSGQYISKLFGHSINVQGPMEYQCEMVDRGLSWSDVTEAEEGSIETASEKWKLLFQLDSEDEAKMMWGDVGRLYFWIKEDDLKNRQYDKTWMIFQCH